MAKAKDLNNKLKILFVIDMQNDFIDGVYGTKEAVDILPKVKAKAKKYEKDDRFHKICYTMDTHNNNFTSINTTEENKSKSHCIRYSPGWGIHPDIYSYKGSIIEKIHIGTNELYKFVCSFLTFPDGIDNMDTIYQILNDCISHIEIIGVRTDTGVLQNALFLKEWLPTVDIIVDSDCCAGTTPENHKAALQILKNNFIEVI